MRGKMKAQGGTEMLVMIAIALFIIAIIAYVVVMAGGSQSEAVSRKESIAYWQSMTPISITDFSMIDKNHPYLMLKSRVSEKIEIRRIYLFPDPIPYDYFNFEPSSIANATVEEELAYFESVADGEDYAFKLTPKPESQYLQPFSEAEFHYTGEAQTPCEKTGRLFTYYVYIIFKKGNNGMVEAGKLPIVVRCPSQGTATAGVIEYP